MTMIRWSSGISAETMPKRLVLPELVPPETIMFLRSFTQMSRNCTTSSLSEPKRTRSLSVMRSLANLRIAIAGPLREHGGKTMATREPSGRRASR